MPKGLKGFQKGNKLGKKFQLGEQVKIKCFFVEKFL